VTDEHSGRITYASYLHIPELVALQTPTEDPSTGGEMLFIIGQQVQELWFKQILFDLSTVIRCCENRDIPRATLLMQRVNRITHALSTETEILETLAPHEFHRFRGRLKTASGFESEQFRELEIACGLRGDEYLRFAKRLVDIDAVLARWPISLHDAFVALLAPLDRDPVAALVRLYGESGVRPDLYVLAEAMSEFDLNFVEWRFHHIRVLERVIGDRSPGTGGSPGARYLEKTLRYRFFPELWEARNRMTSLVPVGV
jgi:tryptophan 2,3-dioxygenase